MSLRARLVLALVGLAAAGLVVAGTVTYRALETYLIDRVDAELASYAQSKPLGAGPAFNTPGSPRGGSGNGGSTAGGNGTTQGDGDGGVPSGGGPQPPLPAGTYVALLSSSGAVEAHYTFLLSGEQGSGNSPVVPTDIVKRVSPGHTVTETISNPKGTESYRLLAKPVAGGGALVLATPLTDVEATLTRLLRLEGAVGGLVLLLLAGLAYVIVRAELRPLERMGATANAIAAGDLSRRVDPATERTEVGRLGLALNGMLTQIERAFSERRRSELQLRASEQRLRASDAQLRRFVSDASHELRTPLTSIRGYAEMFHRGAAERPADLETAMRRIEQEAARMGVLVEDLLLLAHLDEGRPLASHPVNVADVVSDAVLDARAVAPDRDISLEAPAHVAVLGDEPSLRQAVGNLVRNALLHTPAGSRIEVALRPEGETVLLTVADHGPGIPPDASAHVFERFYRADAGRSRARGGTGLGLSIVAAIIAAHSGTVSVGPTDGGGATFAVTLPLAATEPAPAPAPR